MFVSTDYIVGVQFLDLGARQLLSTVYYDLCR